MLTGSLFQRLIDKIEQLRRRNLDDVLSHQAIEQIKTREDTDYTNYAFRRSLRHPEFYDRFKGGRGIIQRAVRRLGSPETWDGYIHILNRGVDVVGRIDKPELFLREKSIASNNLLEVHKDLRRQHEAICAIDCWVWYRLKSMKEYYKIYVNVPYSDLAKYVRDFMKLLCFVESELGSQDVCFKQLNPGFLDDTPVDSDQSLWRRIAFLGRADRFCIYCPDLKSVQTTRLILEALATKYQFLRKPIFLHPVASFPLFMSLNGQSLQGVGLVYTASNTSRGERTALYLDHMVDRFIEQNRSAEFPEPRNFYPWLVKLLQQDPEHRESLALLAFIEHPNRASLVRSADFQKAVGLVEAGDHSLVLKMIDLLYT